MNYLISLYDIDTHYVTKLQSMTSFVPNCARKECDKSVDLTLNITGCKDPDCCRPLATYCSWECYHMQHSPPMICGGCGKRERVKTSCFCDKCKNSYSRGNFCSTTCYENYHAGKPFKRLDCESAQTPFKLENDKCAGCDKLLTDRTIITCVTDDKGTKYFCSSYCHSVNPHDRWLTVAGLKAYADGLNIEGGFPAIDCKTRWVSHVVILDDPLVTGVTFDELLKEVNENKWPMLENSVLGLNEPRLLASYMAILGYYMAKHDKITVHVHQFPEQCKHLVEQLKIYVKVICEEFKFDQEKKQVSFKTDNPFYISPETDRKYDCEVLISLSQCAGVCSSTLKEGDMIAADTFIPFEVKTSTMYVSKKYAVGNSLAKDKDDLLNSVYLRFAIEQLGEYRSANPKKSHVVRNKSEFVFANATLLQADGIWNPKSKDEVVKVK